MNLDAERERLRGLASKATEGPWRVNGSFEVMAGETKVAKAMSLGEHEFIAPRRDANAKFLAAAHDMLALIDAQASALAEMQERLEACFDDAEIALASKEAETIERCAKAIKDKVAEHAKAFPESRHEHARLTFALDGATFTAAIRALGKGT